MYARRGQKNLEILLSHGVNERARQPCAQSGPWGIEPFSSRKLAGYAGSESNEGYPEGKGAVRTKTQ